MNPKSKRIRRSFGTACLLAAIVMLVAGETVLDGRLSPTAFALYWLGCLAVTVMAVATALADLRAVRRESRAEQRALVEQTLQNVPPKPTPTTGRSRE